MGKLFIIKFFFHLIFQHLIKISQYDINLTEIASIELKDWILDAKFLFENVKIIF